MLAACSGSQSAAPAPEPAPPDPVWEVSWNLVDGSAGYEVVWRPVDRPYWDHEFISGGAINRFELGDLDPGRYELRMAAFNYDGLSSSYSETLQFTVP